MMNTLKSLLLGTAAGLVAIAGAQAADLPVKAKAVQYVKICSLYGAGFYYIPGTDTCLKVGGFVRADYYVNSNSSGGFAQLTTYNRRTNYLGTRARAAITLDVRSQTAYGTLRSYTRFGVNANDSGQSPGGGGLGTSLYLQYAYIQFAGFTFGLAKSFFDTYAIDAVHTNHRFITSATTDSSGVDLLAYTASFGNGVTATLSLEGTGARANAGVFNVTAAGVATIATKGSVFPDVVGNIRVEQEWGYAGISAALHDTSGTWYGAPVGGVIPNTAGASLSDKLGFAVSAGALFKVPGTGGDTFGFQAAYSKGATGYVTNLGSTFGGMGTGLFTVVRGGQVTQVFVSNAVYGSAAGSAYNLTEAWGIEGGYEHVWMPGLKTSLAAGYTEINYNAAASALLCGGVATCNADVSWYQIGSRTSWSPVENLTISGDVVYTNINDASRLGAAGVFTVPAGTVPGDAGIWSGMLRVERAFWK